MIEERNMFCPNCGTSLSDTAEFCSNCGYNIKTGQASQAPPQTPYAPSQPYGQPYFGASFKSEALAIILAILVPGAGHLYIGRLTRGLVVLVTYFGISAISIITVFSAFPQFIYGTMEAPAIGSGLIIALILLSLISMIIWIVQLIDAYNLTKQYNETVRRTGQAPW
jgi:TM2 domain-containing membrane protein YozV